MPITNMNLNNISLAACAAVPGQLISDPRKQIVFSGRSNVGKSSLINAVCGRRGIARVSSSPGKTQTVNYYLVDGKCYFVDLPGYGYAKASKERRERFSGVTDAYLNSAFPALVVQLVDIRIGATEDDYLMLEWLIYKQLPFFIAATKADKIKSKSALEAAVAGIKEQAGGAEVVPFSAESGMGKDAVVARILGCLR